MHREKFFSKSPIRRKPDGGDLPFFQAKLTIGQPGDKYEQEADAMADKVVNRQSQPNPNLQQKCAQCEQEGPVLPKLQRQEEEEEAQMQPEIQRMGQEEEEAQMMPEIKRMGEEGEEEAQMKPELQRQEEEGEEEAQMKPQQGIMRKADGSMQAGSSFTQKLQASKGGGKNMSNGMQTEMGRSFGADFSGVRVHTDNRAIQLNKDIKAQAFTHGQDIYFNQGKYKPESTEGRKLIAHELTHTIQQGAVR